MPFRVGGAERRIDLGSIQKALGADHRAQDLAWAKVVIVLGLDEKDRAFEWLEKAYQDRSYELIYLKVDPALDKIHADSRFTDLVRRVGIP